MKTNKSFSVSGLLAQAVFAVLAIAVLFTGCKQETPFDTQSPDDAPLILKPYNESGTGSFTYQLANPDTPLYDSVTATPSRYTTINWYLDNQLIFTGTKINMCFPAGTYALTIEAVTEAGKRTTRTGTVNVSPYDTDPYAGAPGIGRYCVPGFDLILEGRNLTQVASVILSDDIAGTSVVSKIAASTDNDGALVVTLPALADGMYFVRLQDAEGKLYGADAVHIYNAALAVEGFEEFIPGEDWTISGQNLANVKSVKVGDKTITEITATASSVTFKAPAVEEGKYTISMTNKDGSSVLFITNDGAVTEAQTAVSSETVIWTGPVTIDWNADLVKINKSVMDAVPVGSSIIVYFEVVDAEYHAMRITTPWWGDNDLVAQIDGMENVPSPYVFTYDDRCKGIVDMVGDWSIVGFGLQVNKITYK